MERQKHGFDYEKSVIERLNLVKYDKYTDKFDARNSDINYQIKCIKRGNNIELGDIFRNFRIEKDFILIVGFWESTKDNIVEEYKIVVKADIWQKQFEDANLKELKDILSISNSKEDDSIWKQEVKRLRNTWNEKQRFIKPRFKRDHKKQKRIQCAINNKDFYNTILKVFSWQKL